jgi:hypothetical protein
MLFSCYLCGELELTRVWRLAKSFPRRETYRTSDDKMKARRRAREPLRSNWWVTLPDNPSRHAVLGGILAA